jgi:L-fuconolactonase
MARWEELLRAAAERPNVHAKVSGLNTATADWHWTADDLQPAVEVALDAFGIERLVYESDWPVCLLNGTYERVQHETLLAVARACDEPQAILEGNAERLYRLADAAVPFVRERA